MIGSMSLMFISLSPNDQAENFFHLFLSFKHPSG
jgi:hypothetical protein